MDETNLNEGERNAEEVEAAKNSRQLYWVLGGMAALLLIATAVYFAYERSKVFDYEGLAFREESFGEIPVYHYVFGASPLTGEVIDEGVGRFDLFLRIDPRENDVYIEENPVFDMGEKVYITVNGTGLTQCPFSTLSVGSLATFLRRGGVSAEGAVVDEMEALEGNVTHVTCENTLDNNVIWLHSGEETRIDKEGRSCWSVSVSNCEVLEAVEKFMVQTLVEVESERNV